MFDRYNRQINYLRISVTDRCNLRCSYCMPVEGIKLLPGEEILSFEEIAVVVKAAAGLGIEKFRLTGGEPLVREGISSLVAMLAAIPGVKELVMSTNGILLRRYAADLRKAGLQRVNVSLDTVDPGHYHELTRGGNLDAVLEGIDAAIENGLLPVKINCVVLESSEEPNAREVKKFCDSRGLGLRYIHMMSLPGGVFSEVEGGNGGVCGSCNRLRLTSNGMVKPCLFDEQEFPVRILGAEQALRAAIQDKPARGGKNRFGTFYGIGG